MLLYLVLEVTSILPGPMPGPAVVQADLENYFGFFFISVGFQVLLQDNGGPFLAVTQADYLGRR